MGNGTSNPSPEGGNKENFTPRQETEELPYTPPLMIEYPPTFGEKFIASFEEPLRIAADCIYGKEFLVCEINRIGNSYRSPWSNTYAPPLPDGTSAELPPQDLRKLEINMNFGFEQYYEGGLSSAYAKPIDIGFAVVLLLKKEKTNNYIKAAWDTIHVFEVQELRPYGRALYRLTSKTMLWLETSGEPNKMQLGGTMSHQMQQEHPISQVAPHIACFGRMIDAMEIKIRNACVMCFGRGKKIKVTEGCGLRESLQSVN